MGLAHRLAMVEADLLAAMLSEKAIPPRFAPLAQRLASAGYEKEESLRVVEALARRLTDPNTPAEVFRRELRSTLAEGVRVAPSTERIAPGLVVFIGAAGVGKTTMAAKLAADLSLGGTPRPVLGALKPRPGVGVEALRRCASTLGIEYVEANQPREIAALRDRADRQPIILDSSAVNPRSPQAVEGLAALLEGAPEAEVHAVIPATHASEDFGRQLTAFASFPRIRMSVTRLDEAPYPGRILAASSSTGVPVGYLSLGPRIPDDLSRPGLEGLVDAVLRAEGGLAA
ncbi:MAG: hypothetical protein HC923_05270 [Myxococcales bacterium]|nr:hypothetical protein [Myxococcales bacterium]